MSKLARFRELLDEAPPRAWSPQPRDLAIYEAVRFLNRPQQEVAAAYGLTQPRVSQIVKRMAGFLGGEAVAPGGLVRARVEARAEQQRHERLYDEALRGYARSRQPGQVVRTRRGPDGEVIERVVTERRPDVKLIKLAREHLDAWRAAGMRTADLLGNDAVQMRWRAAIETLIEMRSAAQELSMVPRAGGPRRAVRQALRELLGLDQLEAAMAAVAAHNRYTDDDENVGTTCEEHVGDEAAKDLPATTCDDDFAAEQPAEPAPGGETNRAEITFTGAPGDGPG